MPDETRETAFPDDSRNAKEKSPGNAAGRRMATGVFI